MPAVWKKQEFFSLGSPTGTTQTFDVPANVSCVFVTMTGAGGGGGASRVASSTLSSGGGGGGAGEWCIMAPHPVTAGGTVTLYVGEGGPGGNRSTTSYPGITGETSYFGNIKCAGGGGGGGGQGGGDTIGGVGGGPRGAAGQLAAAGIAGTIESHPGWHGGASGGGYDHGIGTAKMGGPAPGVGNTPAGSASGANSAGGSGAASMWGVGGVGGDGATPATNNTGRPAPSTSYGAGGGGGGTDSTVKSWTLADGVGGRGADGYICVYWIEEA